ncbi:MAG: gamma-glutamyl-gamma-aminobutyrate hydrolase family protein [Dermatophilaceae bacterium]
MTNVMAFCSPAGPIATRPDFGEERHEKTAGIDHDRDRAEYAIVKWALAEDKPMFGICRGEQVMNVAMGGTLIQDIPSQWETETTHAWQARATILPTLCR